MASSGWSPLLVDLLGPTGVAKLVERFGRTKACSVGIELPGVPSLVLENRPGMEAVIEHLVGAHRRRKIAFLAGTPNNPEAKVRFDAYQTVLARHGIACDSARIASGYFRTNSAKVAMEEILARGVEFDAVVAANDEMATGAIDVLRKQGLRVPQDIPVTGFDDLMLARLGNPPLTTVAQPFDRVADWAVRAIEEQSAGLRLPPRTEFAARFVRRQSCGCGYEAYRRDAPGRAPGLIRRQGIHDRAPRDAVARAGRTSWHRLANGCLGGNAPARWASRGDRRSARGVPRGRSSPCWPMPARTTSGNECFTARSVTSATSCGAGRTCRSSASCSMDWTWSRSQTRPARCSTACCSTRNYLRLLGVGEQGVDRLRPGVVAGRAGEGLPAPASHRVPVVHAGADKGALRSVMCFGAASSWTARTSSTPASQLLRRRAARRREGRAFLVLLWRFRITFSAVIAFNYSDGMNAYCGVPQ
jgi:hypothetical protein